MLKYERGLILAGQAIRDELVGQGGHADLADIEADLAARKAELARLEAGEAHEVRRLHPSLEGKFNISPLTIDGTPKGELLKVKAVRGIPVTIYSDARSVVENSAFTTLSEPRQIDLVIGAVEDLVPNPKDQFATTAEIEFARAEKGLVPVPAEAALHYLLKYGDTLQVGESIWFNMDPIADHDGDPRFLGVGRGGGGLWLNSNWTEPSGVWRPADRIAFGLPQVAEA